MDEKNWRIQECVQKLREGQLAPWKVEEELATTHGIETPESFRIAAICRQLFIETITGEKFHHIFIPEEPYKERYFCEKDDYCIKEPQCGYT